MAVASGRSRLDEARAMREAAQAAEVEANVALKEAHVEGERIVAEAVAEERRRAAEEKAKREELVALARRLAAAASARAASAREVAAAKEVEATEAEAAPEGQLSPTARGIVGLLDEGSTENGAQELDVEEAGVRERALHA